MTHDELVEAFFQQQRRLDPEHFKKTAEQYPILSRFRVQQIQQRELSLEELEEHNHERKFE